MVIRVVLVDDHPVVRMGLRGMLAAEPDIEVVGEGGSGTEAFELAVGLKPDVVLMDLRMPGEDGVSATERIVAAGGPPVLVVTTYDSDRDILRAVEAGATGYLLKDAPRRELFRAVRAAARGESVLSPSVAGRLMTRMRNPAPQAEELSQRELEVLGLVARGASNREAAGKLFISEATVKTHLLHIYAKLGVNDRAAAVAVAYERGLFA